MTNNIFDICTFCECYPASSGDGKPCTMCPASGREISTKADRIRAMDDEELAEFLCGFRSDGTDHFVCMECVAGNYCKMGHNGMIDWLKQPAEEDKHDQ